jgi:hypothetical protein
LINRLEKDRADALAEVGAASAPRICFVEASGQNAFFGELVAALRHAVEREGLETETAIDHFPPQADDLVYVFVPHEFLPLTLAPSHPTENQLRRTIVVSTEQPGTTWFEEAAPIAYRAGMTLDINPLGLAELRRRGVRAERLVLGYVPEWDHWGGDEEHPRPIDVTFIGGYTERRGKALARCGRLLSSRRTVLHMTETTHPHTYESAHFLVGERKWRHLASTKILVNIHRDDAAYFEWQRIGESMMNGCVVVTEHSLGVFPLVPGEHLVSATAESLPFVLGELLENEDWLRSLRQRSYALFRDELTLDPAPLLKAAKKLAAESLPTKAPLSTGPLPRRLSAPKPAWTKFSEPGKTGLARMALKRIVLTQRRLERRLARLEHPAEHAEPSITRFGPRDSGAPRLSVVVSLHNYERFIGEAARSVAMSDYTDLELVVVDDASTDGSYSTAAHHLSKLDWLSSTLAGVPFNEGLPAARNRGAELARGEFLFILDADNAIYPHAIGRLVEALDDDPAAAFAYGILERFDATGSIDLMNWLPWSRARLALGNYVDATALIRREAFDKVGGYTTDERLYGWEDFALWCAFADADLYGVHVPEIVARYRAGRVSMIDFTNIDTSDAWSALLERYAFLADPGLELTSG